MKLFELYKAWTDRRKWSTFSASTSCTVQRMRTKCWIFWTKETWITFVSNVSTMTRHY